MIGTRAKVPTAAAATMLLTLLLLLPLCCYHCCCCCHYVAAIAAATAPAVTAPAVTAGDTARLLLLLAPSDHLLFSGNILSNYQLSASDKCTEPGHSTSNCWDELELTQLTKNIPLVLGEVAITITILLAFPLNIFPCRYHTASALLCDAAT